MDIDPSRYTANEHPGKFEGENPASEYYYEQMLAGDGEAIYGPTNIDGSEEEASLFKVNADEAAAFGLPIGHWYMVRLDWKGFCLGSLYASREDAEQAFVAWVIGE